MRVVGVKASGVIVGLVLVGALVTACGAGQQAQTANQTSATGGVGGRIDTIEIRDAQFGADQQPVAGDSLYQPGQNAPVQVTIVNDATMTADDALAPDRLVSVRSPVARSGRIIGDARVPDGQALVAGYTRPGASVRTDGSREIAIELVGLTEPLRAGMTYPVEFTFARAGSLRLDLPVENPQFTKPRADTPLVYPPPEVGTYPGTPAGSP